MGAALYGSRHWCVPHRDCRKESKELLVRPTDARVASSTLNEIRHHVSMASAVPRSDADTSKTEDQPKYMEVNPLIAALDREVAKPTGKIQQGKGDAIIGGGCCVELAIEYMPTLPTLTNVPGSDTPSFVRVAVADSEGAILMWSKLVGPGYHVKEGIITTYPGAVLRVEVLNAIARVRWCEIFSC
jgi:hypothetical protein